MAVAQVPVFCNGLHGLFLLGRQRIVCSCGDCMAKPEAMREHSCTQFEMHCGAGAAKKWKASLRVQPGGVPECPAGARAALLVWGRTREPNLEHQVTPQGGGTPEGP